MIAAKSYERWAQEIAESYPFHPGLHELFARFRENPGFQVWPDVATCRGPRTVCRVDRHDLAVDQPMEQVAQRGEALLDGGCRQLARRRLVSCPAGRRPRRDALRVVRRRGLATVGRLRRSPLTRIPTLQRLRVSGRH